MALSADTTVRVRGEFEVQDIPVVASDIIYKGAIVCVDTSGYAAPAADTSGYRFVGIAMEKADNSSGSAGDISVKVAIIGSGGRFLATLSGAAQTDVGEICYVTDDASLGTPGTDPGNTVVVGRLIEYVSATSGWVSGQAFGVNA